MVGSLQTVFYLTLPSSVWCVDYSTWRSCHLCSVTLLGDGYNGPITVLIWAPATIF